MNRSQILHYLKPGLTDDNGARTLLVWGDLGQWLVVDAELKSLLELFNGKRPIKQALRRHSRKWGKEERAVEREAMPILQQMVSRGILRPDGGQPRLVLEPIRIANITLNVTNQCNLRCAFCYNDSRRAGDAPIESLMASIGRDRDLFSEEASFILLGGEPFLDPDRTLTAITTANEQFSPPVLVSTNGTTIDARTASRLAATNVEVQVSVDAPDAATHDAGRGSGVFARAMRGIDHLTSAGVPLILSMVYTATNLDQFEPYLELAVRFGAKEARFIPLRQIGGGLGFSRNAPNQIEAFERLLELLDRRPEFRSLLGRDYFSIIMAMCRFTLPRSGCGIGRQVIFVDSDGTVYPCPNHAVPDLAAGNLLDRPLAEIVSEAPVMTAVRNRYRVDRYTECRECPFRSWCAGDCRGEVLSVSGDPQAPSPHCANLKDVYRRALWLLADGDQRLGLSQDTQIQTC